MLPLLQYPKNNKTKCRCEDCLFIYLLIVFVSIYFIAMYLIITSFDPNSKLYLDFNKFIDDYLNWAPHQILP